MGRVAVINEILGKIGGRTYLEIGIRYGRTFNRIIAPRKIGVDPVNAAPRVREHLLGHMGATYHCKTSDEFFVHHGHIFSNQKIDVALIDGLHTYGQSLKDVINCLAHLADNGVIVMHDCSPPAASMAEPLQESRNADGRPNLYKGGPWNGDVWKTIVHLRSCFDVLNVFVLDCDFGLGVVTKGRPDNMLDLSVEEIQEMTFNELDKERELLLNLKNPEYLSEFLTARALA